MKNATIKNLWVAIFIALFSVNAGAQSTRSIEASKARVIDHWSSERRAAAIPRDLVIDPRGLGYLRRLDGSLEPHGHNIAVEATAGSQTPSPFAKPGGGTGDTTGPGITNMDPAGGTIAASYTFKATVTDPSGVRLVTFKVQKAGATAQSFSATKTAGTNNWTTAL